MTVEKINKWCDNCPHVACETCQITWTDIEELKKDIKDNYISKYKIGKIFQTKILNYLSKTDWDDETQRCIDDGIVQILETILQELLEEE